MGGAGRRGEVGVGGGGGGREPKRGGQVLGEDMWISLWVRAAGKGSMRQSLSLVLSSISSLSDYLPSGLSAFVSFHSNSLLRLRIR